MFKPIEADLQLQTFCKQWDFRNFGKNIFFLKNRSRAVNHAQPTQNWNIPSPFSTG